MKWSDAPVSSALCDNERDPVGPDIATVSESCTTPQTDNPAYVGRPLLFL